MSKRPNRVITAAILLDQLRACLDDQDLSVLSHEDAQSIQTVAQLVQNHLLPKVTPIAVGRQREINAAEIMKGYAE